MVYNSFSRNGRALPRIRSGRFANRSDSCGIFAWPRENRTCGNKFENLELARSGNPPDNKRNSERPEKAVSKETQGELCDDYVGQNRSPTFDFARGGGRRNLRERTEFTSLPIGKLEPNKGLQRFRMQAGCEFLDSNFDASFDSKSARW